MKTSVRAVIAFMVLSSLLTWGKKPKPVVYRNTAPGVAFTGSKSCAAAGCHEQIYHDFQSAPMGNSMTPANTPSRAR